MDEEYAGGEITVKGRDLSLVLIISLLFGNMNFSKIINREAV
jgi:hypothetical protein